MTNEALAGLTELEGRIVGVALRDGSRLDDCRLIALPLRRARRFWFWTGAEDVFVSADDVIDVWEAASTASSR